MFYTSPFVYLQKYDGGYRSFDRGNLYINISGGMFMTYSGIGSRSTPTSVKPLIIKIAKFLDSKGYTLRSGGAEGADSFFESGAGAKEIFLPWAGFNGNTSHFDKPSPEAFKLAEKYHPAWDRLGQGAKKLMARNSHQVLGVDLNSPVDFVVYWSEPNKGGTQQAIRIAEDHNIPVFNLKISSDLDKFRKLCKTFS